MSSLAISAPHPSAASASSALISQPQAPKNPTEYLLPHLHRDLIPIILEYMTEVFGSEEWQRYFGVDVGPVPSLSSSFFQFWFGPDPIHKGKKVCETHLPPVFRPENVTYNGKVQPFNLELLGEIVQKPKEGNNLGRYRSDPVEDITHPLSQYKKNKAEPACFVVMRNDGVVAEGQPYDEQIKTLLDLNVGYEAGPSILDIATVVFIRHTTTGHYLGFDSNEGWSYSSCKEIVNYYGKEFHLCVGSHNLEGLDIYYFQQKGDSQVGIVGLRKFLKSLVIR